MPTEFTDKNQPAEADSEGGQPRKAVMKNVLFVVSVAAALFAVGCAGPRTGSVGFRQTPAILTTNVVGTVTSQQVGDQPPVVYAQTNFTIVSTPPVQDRTWREKAFGQRPPADVRVIPPFPNSGVYGVTPTTIMVPRSTGRVRSRIGRLPSGAPVLLPNRPASRSGVGVSGTFATFGGGLRSFLLPTIYPAKSGARLTYSAGVHGRVPLPVTDFERSALGHARQVDPGFRSNRLRSSGVSGFSTRVRLVGAAQFRSGQTGRGGY